MFLIGRRKRKQPSYKRVKRVPKIFTCPECGEKSVKVENLKKGGIATVKCGHCGLSMEVLVNSISEPVDAFGDFIDLFYADQEIQRLEKRIPKLMKENEYGELALSYAILADICRAKAYLLLEEEDLDMEKVDEWKIRAEKYKRLEKDAVLKLDTEEIESGLKTDDESLFSEIDDTSMKKEKKIDDVFSDPGFLEW